jgi:ABC-type glycerol-3-phosphate transport system substrate-binding protein
MFKKLSQRQIVIMGGGVVLVIVLLIIIFLNLRPSNNVATQTKLTVWGTESQTTFGPFVVGYPSGQVVYTQIDPANYGTQLLSALAAGTGPDVFEISNRELPKWKSVLAPMPAALSQTFGMLQLQNSFPDVVAQDFVSGGQIYGLPLSIDTLAMVYNKDLFNSAGIALPPKTWDDFDVDIAQLRSVNAQGQIAQAAAAIGGSEASIPNATDLLSLLMLQNGATMTNTNPPSAQFASGNGGAGSAAFNFYLQFANAVSPYYTWNDSMGNAADSFVNGKTAIVFAYQADLAAIKAKAPFLNIGVAPVPQAKGASVAVTYPKYYGFVVSKAGQSAAAWNFILYLTVASGDGKLYGNATGKPPALRADIQADANDPTLSVFASQALTAKSWYEADATKIDGILNSAIVNALNGGEDAKKALQEAETAVTQLMTQ